MEGGRAKGKKERYASDKAGLEFSGSAYQYDGKKCVRARQTSRSAQAPERKVGKHKLELQSVRVYGGAAI